MKKIQKNSAFIRVIALVVYVSTILALELINNKTVGTIIFLFMCSIAAIGIILNYFNLNAHNITLKDELNKISYWTVIFLLIDLITMIGIPLLYDLLGINVVSENQQGVEDSLKNDFSIFLLFIVVILGPIIEEGLFRFLPRIIFKNNIAFILVSSCVFALMHCIGSENIFWVFLLYLPSSIFLSYAYYRTDDLFVTICMHIVTNLLSVILILRK